MNEIIANFMGWEVSNEVKTLVKRGLTFEEIPYGFFKVNPKDLKYDSSWGWLMPVFDKIESLGFDTEISRGNSISNYGSQSCNIGKDFCLGDDEKTINASALKETKLEAAHTAVVKFIKWYNKEV